MKNIPYWSKPNVWACPNHLPSAKMPRSEEKCWFRNCESNRPELPTLKKERTKIINIPSTTLCYWWGCDKNNGTPAPKRKTSKYCSIDCKNKNARWRYKLRKKAS